jgi:hypothetical protein
LFRVCNRSFAPGPAESLQDPQNHSRTRRITPGPAESLQDPQNRSRTRSTLHLGLGIKTEGSAVVPHRQLSGCWQFWALLMDRKVIVRLAMKRQTPLISLRSCSHSRQQLSTWSRTSVPKILHKRAHSSAVHRKPFPTLLRLGQRLLRRIAVHWPSICNCRAPIMMRDQDGGSYIEPIDQRPCT